MHLIKRIISLNFWEKGIDKNNYRRILTTKYAALINFKDESFTFNSIFSLPISL